MNRSIVNRGKNVLILLALMIGVGGGIMLERLVLSPAGTTVQVPPGAGDEFRLIAETWRLIEQNYVDQEDVQPEQMAYSAARGMVQTLDDAGHTRFLSPEMAQQHQQQIQAKFEGIGAYVEMREGRVVIVAPIDDSPAQEAGLEPGDVILAVNGEEVEGLSLTQVVDRIVGPAGTEVTLRLLNPDIGETRTVTLERATIDIDLVTWQRLPGTDAAYLRISSFSEGAAEELEGTLEDIHSAEDVSGVILDLRSNPGGLLDEAIGVASHFIEDGVVLRRREAQGQVTEEMVQEDVEAVEIPLVVLANEGSSSGAEVVIGALQDHERASVVGTTTFGAGTVLNQFDLPEGALLLLAVEEWLTPDGRVIWQEGLEPDIQVALPEDAAPLMRFQLEDITAEELQNSEDQQLLRALEVLAEVDNR